MTGAAMTAAPELPASVIEALGRVSVATLSTVLFKRGLRNMVMDGPRPIGPGTPHLVGQAFTLRTIPAREDLDQLSVFEDPTHPQRVAVETCPPGWAMCVDSRGDARAASAGGILLARLRRRGCAGFVTDGGLRDSADIAALGFPAYHVRPSAPTNLIRHHAVDIGVPIGCGGVPVFPGDVLVGDADGVICVPLGIAADVAAEATAQTEYEDWVAAQVEAGAALPGLYPMTDPAWRRRFADRGSA